MSQTESERFNAWWWSDARNINPSKAHAWVVWLAAATVARERLEELEVENERLRHGMSVLCREFREAAQEDIEEGGDMAAAYSYYADRIDALMQPTTRGTMPPRKIMRCE